jgi:NAD(P)-dependent dehydrogenase (short-subunit alcohol dehydrogenase family)
MLQVVEERVMLTNAIKVGDREIRVNCISPGVIDTPMHRAANVTRGNGNVDREMQWSIKRKGQAEEVAALIAWLLCDSSSYITGTVQVCESHSRFVGQMLTAYSWLMEDGSVRGLVPMEIEIGDLS